MKAPVEDFPPTWVLLQPLVDPDGVPARVRVRRAFKALLRGYGIRVEKVQGAEPVEDLAVELHELGPRSGCGN